MGILQVDMGQKQALAHKILSSLIAVVAGHSPNNVRLRLRHYW